MSDDFADGNVITVEYNNKLYYVSEAYNGYFSFRSVIDDEQVTDFDLVEKIYLNGTKPGAPGDTSITDDLSDIATSPDVIESVLRIARQGLGVVTTVATASYLVIKLAGKVLTCGTKALIGLITSPASIPAGLTGTTIVTSTQTTSVIVLVKGFLLKSLIAVGLTTVGLSLVRNRELWLQSMTGDKKLYSVNPDFTCMSVSILQRGYLYPTGDIKLERVSSIDNKYMQYSRGHMNLYGLQVPFDTETFYVGKGYGERNLGRDWKSTYDVSAKLRQSLAALRILYNCILSNRDIFEPRPDGSSKLKKKVTDISLSGLLLAEQHSMGLRKRSFGLDENDSFVKCTGESFATALVVNEEAMRLYSRLLHKCSEKIAESGFSKSIGDILLQLQNGNKTSKGLAFLVGLINETFESAIGFSCLLHRVSKILNMKVGETALLSFDAYAKQSGDIDSQVMCDSLSRYTSSALFTIDRKVHASRKARNSFQIQTARLQQVMDGRIISGFVQRLEPETLTGLHDLSIYELNKGHFKIKEYTPFLKSTVLRQMTEEGTTVSDALLESVLGF